LAPLTRGLSGVIFVQARPACGPALVRIEGTRDPVARLRALAEDNAVETFLIGLINTDKPVETEARLRETFKPSVVRGRWFAANADLMGFIQFNAQTALNDLLGQLRPHSHPTGTTTIEEIAQHLNVSVSTVRRMVKDGQIPYLRAGRQLRFIPADVVASLQKS
jgi:excisionase family DNA binding protein